MGSMADTNDLMTIGEFSARSRLSVRMLRHYDEHGVLMPAQVDHATGYRWYAAAQLPEAAEVRRLRDVGFAVSAIATVLAARGTPAWTHALTLRREELAVELSAAAARLALLDTILTTEGPTMSITVSRTTAPAMCVASLRGTVPTYADEGLLWARFVPELQRQGLQAQGPGGVIEHDTEYRERDVDESVWLPIPPGSRASAPLEILDMPARDVVVARIVGPYSLISEAHARIEEFLAAHHLRAAEHDAGTPATKVFNRYLTDPSTTSPQDAVTEVCVPLA